MGGPPVQHSLHKMIPHPNPTLGPLPSKELYLPLKQLTLFGLELEVKLSELLFAKWSSKSTKLGEPEQGVKALIYERKRKDILPHYFIKVAISGHQLTCLSFFRMSPGTKAHADIEGWMTLASSIFLKWASLPAKKANFCCTLLVTGATSPVSISCSRMVKFLTSNLLRAYTSWNSDCKLASWDPSNRSYKWASSSGPHSATFRTSLLELGTICANLPPRFKRCSFKNMIVKKILL